MFEPFAPAFVIHPQWELIFRRGLCTNYRR